MNAIHIIHRPVGYSGRWLRVRRLFNSESIRDGFPIVRRDIRLQRLISADLISRSSASIENRNAGSHFWMTGTDDGTTREECIPLRSLVPRDGNAVSTLALLQGAILSRFYESNCRPPFHFLRHRGLSTPCQAFRVPSTRGWPTYEVDWTIRRPSEARMTLSRLRFRD